MIRLCVILIRVALVLAVSLLASFAKRWLIEKIVERIRRRRIRRKMRSWAGHHLDEVPEDFNVEKERFSMAMNTGLRSSSNAGIMGVVSVIVLQLLPLIPGFKDLAATPEFASAVTGLLMWLGSRFTKTPSEPGVV